MPDENTATANTNTATTPSSTENQNPNDTTNAANKTDENKTSAAPTISGDMIPIGFGLEGYQVKNTAQDATGAGGGMGGGGFGGANGTSAAFNLDTNSLVDGRWMPDKNLKQVVVQCTCFQSAPLKYNAPEGTTYINLGDGIDKWDDNGLTAFGISIGGKIDNAKKNVEEWASKLNGKDFDAGVGICPKTLADYLNYFYGLNVDFLQAHKLCQKKIVNAEVLYNIGTGQGKAYRLRVVDSAGKAGYKGGPNNCKGQHIIYDILDTNVSVLLSKGFDDVMKWKSRDLGPINTGTLDFPWKDVVYDYKTGTIPGYNPNAIKEWQNCSFGSKDVSIVKCAIWTAKTDNGRGLPLACVRFFVDEENLATARTVISGLPDEFAKCNYENGAIQATGGVGDFNLDGYSSVGSAVHDMAAKISNWCQQDAKGKFTYVQIANAAGPAIKDASWPWNFQPNGSSPANRYKPCCGSYVWWVLCEAGLTNNTVCSFSTRMEGVTPDQVNKFLKPEFKAVSVGRDVANLQKGDILIFGIGTSHGAIFDSMSGTRIVEYGFGQTKWMDGSYNGPHAGRTQSSLKDIIRIVKADGSGGATNTTQTT